MALLGAQDPGSVAQILSECYTPDETYGSAFGKLFARLLAASGLILLDPLDLRLHQIAEPIFAKAIEQRDSLEEQLLARGKALENADYGAQVKVSSRSTVLFHISGAMADRRSPATRVSLNLAASRGLKLNSWPPFTTNRKISAPTHCCVR